MINIRNATVKDAAKLLEIYSYYVENTAITFEYDVPSLSEFASRIERTLEKYPYLVIETGRGPQGYAYAGAFASRAAYGWACETTIYLSPSARGQGLGRLLYAALENELKRMGVLNMYACIAYPTEEDEYLTARSAIFHERIGFTQVGRFHRCGYKFGRWYDMIWMEKLIGPHSPAALPVRRFNETAQ